MAIAAMPEIAHRGIGLPLITGNAEAGWLPSVVEGVAGRSATNFARRVGPNMRLTFVTVEHTPLTGRGKLRTVVNETLARKARG